MDIYEIRKAFGSVGCKPSVTYLVEDLNINRSKNLKAGLNETKYEQNIIIP